MLTEKLHHTTFKQILCGKSIWTACNAFMLVLNLMFKTIFHQEGVVQNKLGLGTY